MAAENPAATDDELTLGFGCRSRFGDSGFRALEPGLGFKRTNLGFRLLQLRFVLRCGVRVQDCDRIISSVIRFVRYSVQISYSELETAPS